MTFVKTLALAAATVASTASIASAYNALPFGDSYEATDTLNLEVVRAEGAGVVEIYDFTGGQRGDLLGSEAVFAGANTDVKVDLGIAGNSDILAVLVVDGEEVLIKDYDVRK